MPDPMTKAIVTLDTVTWTSVSYVAYASVKTWNGLEASKIKSWSGLA